MEPENRIRNKIRIFLEEPWGQEDLRWSQKESNTITYPQVITYFIKITIIGYGDTVGEDMIPARDKFAFSWNYP